MDYKIDKDFLSSTIKKELHAAEAWMESDLAEEQADSLSYYFGEKFGNEEDGFSAVVTRDVLETVEGIMPQLMKLFTSSDQVVEFDPQGPQDEERVEIEARYISHLFMNRGNGYKVLYDWFKDALLMKNGILKAGWEDVEEVQFREYAGLTKEEFELLEAGELEHSDLWAASYEIDSYEVDKEGDQSIYKVRLKIERMRGYPVCSVVPSEEFRIKERSTSIKDSAFCAHVMTKTRGELIELGFDEEAIDDAVAEDTKTDSISQARFSNPDESDMPSDLGSHYDREIQYAEAYVRLFDPEDKKVKLYKCHFVGDTCLDYEEVDRVPFISLCPIMVPHKFYGLSVADLVKDIQEIRSTVFRQMLDNLALQNAGRYTAVEGQVNLQDLIDNRIGGIIRQKMPGAVGRLDTPDLSQYTMPMLQQLDLQKEDRTGVSRMSNGLDSQALTSHQTATAVNTVMSAAQEKILLIARNFAETGVKELFIELYNLIREHQTKPDLVPISGRYAIVNPQEWVDRNDIHVTVGIGRGNRDTQMMHLNQIMQMVQMMMQSPYGYLIQPENMFNLVSEFIKNAGYENPVRFVSNPAQVQPPEPQPDAQMITAQARVMDAQTNKFKVENELKLAGDKHSWEKKVNAAEVMMEASQERPVGVGTGK